MAEIPIQEKRRRNLLPLILGALALLLLLGWCMRQRRDDAVPATGDTAAVVTPAPTDTALAAPAVPPPVGDTTRADTTKRP